MNSSLRRQFVRTLGRLLLPVTGLLSLIWFQIRVVPRPSRAAYPCQAAAFPIASAFVLWTACAVASWTGLRQARHWFVRGRTGLAVAALIASLAAGTYAVLEGTNPASATPLAAHFEPTEGPNRPMGVGQGFFSGRVVDPRAGGGEVGWHQGHLVNG